MTLCYLYPILDFLWQNQFPTFQFIQVITPLLALFMHMKHTVKYSWPANKIKPLVEITSTSPEQILLHHWVNIKSKKLVNKLNPLICELNPFQMFTTGSITPAMVFFQTDMKWMSYNFFLVTGTALSSTLLTGTVAKHYWRVDTEIPDFQIIVLLAMFERVITRNKTTFMACISVYVQIKLCW